MRDLTPQMAAELEAQSLRPALLAEFEFDSETLYMWSGVGTLTWNGNDYIGGGNLVQVSTMQETQKLEAKGIICTLSGIPSDLIALALLERTRGRPFRLYLAAIDTELQYDRLFKDDGTSDLFKDDGTSLLFKDVTYYAWNELVVEPYRQFTGLMDVMEFSDDGDTAVIRLSIESAMLIGQRSKIARLTAEDQKKQYPNDKGLDQINQLQDKAFVW